MNGARRRRRLEAGVLREPRAREGRGFPRAFLRRWRARLERVRGATAHRQLSIIDYYARQEGES
jgi:hypothetical protein